MKNTKVIQNINKNDRGESGITLISLIITVIVLIILLGVTELVIPNGLFSKARGGKEGIDEAIGTGQDTVNEIKNEYTDLPGRKGDGEVNTKPEIQVSVKDITGTTAKVVVVGTDEDGDSLTYKLTVIHSVTNESKTYGPQDNGEFPLSGLDKDTTYNYTAVVSDGKDEASKDGSFKTLYVNTAPNINYNALYNKSTNSATIRMRASDEEGDDLVYELYLSTSENGTYTKMATSSSTTQNKYLNLSASNLTKYTDYYWYITANDGKLTSTSDKKQFRTYCPGTGKYHNATECTANKTTKEETCGTCGGAKELTCYGTMEAIGAISNPPSQHNNLSCNGTTQATAYKCSGECGGSFSVVWCETCGYFRDNRISGAHKYTCGTCFGKGTITTTVYTTCSTHNQSGHHYYCTTHGYVGVYSRCNYCEHGKNSQHDS